MTKRLTTACFIWSLLLFTGSLFAQQTNSTEDYTPFLAEVRAFNKYLSQTPPSGSILTKEGLMAARNAMPANNAPLAITPFTKDIPGLRTGKVSIRIFRPDTMRAVLLSIHGGGWSVGTAASDDVLNEYFARTCKVAVISVDYRLAPEDPFPACMDDCKAAAKWLINNAAKEFGTDKIFISGASAGGHLAAVTTLYIRDSLHAIDKVKGVNLIYGCFDLSRTPSNRLASDSALIINKKYLDEIYELLFHGWTEEKLREPQYSPMYASLQNLPPALFTIGTADPLVDDSYFMEARWRLAGNKTFLATYPESPHAFNYFPSKMAAAANRKMCDWMIALCEK